MIDKFREFAQLLSPDSTDNGQQIPRLEIGLSDCRRQRDNQHVEL